MSDHALVIDGQAVAPVATFPVIDPSTGEAFADCPDCTRDQLDGAMAAAQRAFRSWSRDVEVRRAALVAAADALAPHAQAIGELLTREQGKPLKDAVGEVHGAAMWLRETAKLELSSQVLSDDSEQRVELHRRPLGVVGAITPWNFPIILAMWKVASALLAGNTVVLKPSPYTPLSSLAVGRVLQSVFPAGVLNVVSGGDDLGKWVTEHPTVRKISFTGSVATGKQIAAAAAPDLKRVTLELGGNDAAIVLADVDPKKIAEKLFWGAFRNSGQVCVAIKRVYVEEAVYRPIVDELAALARTAVVGSGLEADTQLGPINNRPQFERVNDLIESARSDGAQFAAGGERVSGGGYFVRPTVVTGIEEGSRLVDEEQFGPVVPVMPVASVDDAIARANATHFGLGGSIWTSDSERGVSLASELDCGMSWVNRHGGLSATAPFGGHKWSGIGVENGPYGLASFTEFQVISLAKD